MEQSPSQLEAVIASISENKETIEPTAEQQELLNSIKAALLEKVKNGQQFHSVELRSYTEVIHPDVKNPNLASTRTPDEEPLLARGILVKKLNKEELTLAKEVFGVVVESSEGIFLPVDLSKKDKAQIVLENVSLKFSNALNDNKIVRKNAPYALPLGGMIAGVHKIGIKAALGNIVAKYVGGTMVAPGILPMLGGMAIAGAIVGSAFAVSPLAEKINKVRQIAKDKNDGSEMDMAMNAVQNIDYQTIVSTERSNLLPTLSAEIDQRVTDPQRKFEKKNKMR